MVCSRNWLVKGAVSGCFEVNRIISFCTPLLFFSCLAHGQGRWEETDGLVGLHQDILDLKLYQASQKLEALSLQQDENLYLALLGARWAFFSAYIPDHQGAYLEHEGFFDAQLERVRNGPSEQVRTHMAAAELHLIKAFLELKYGSSWGMAIHGYRSWKALNRASKIDPNHPMVRYGKGIFEMTLGSLPQNYRFFVRLIGLNGSVAQGNRWLEEAMNEEALSGDPFFFPEYAYMSCMVRYQLFEDSRILLSDYGISVETSSFFIYMQVLQLQQRGEHERALELLVRNSTKNGRTIYPLMDLVIGKALLNKQDPTASDYFYRYLNRYKGDNHKKAAFRYLYWHCALADLPATGIEMLKQARKLPARSDMDQQAEEDLNNAIALPLIRVGLLYDGGYDEQALSILDDPGTRAVLHRLSDQMTYYHRKGLIEFRMGRMEAAKESFDKALDLCTEKSYGCAQSWLFSGRIFAAQGHKNEAKRRFKRVLEQDGFAYFESLQQKARTAMEALD